MARHTRRRRPRRVLPRQKKNDGIHRVKRGVHEMNDKQAMRHYRRYRGVAAREARRDRDAVDLLATLSDRGETGDYRDVQETVRGNEAYHRRKRVRYRNNGNGNGNGNGSDDW